MTIEWIPDWNDGRRWELCKNGKAIARVVIIKVETTTRASILDSNGVAIARDVHFPTMADAARWCLYTIASENYK